LILRGGDGHMDIMAITGSEVSGIGMSRVLLTMQFPADQAQTKQKFRSSLTLINCKIDDIISITS